MKNIACPLYFVAAVFAAGCSRELPVNVMADALDASLEDQKTKEPDMELTGNGLCGDMMASGELSLTLTRIADPQNNRYKLVLSDPDGRSTFLLQTNQGHTLAGAGPNGSMPCETLDEGVFRAQDSEFPLLGYEVSCRGRCRTLRVNSPPP